MAKNGKPHETANGLPSPPDAPQSLRQEDLEKVGQQLLRAKPFTADEAHLALEWWTLRLLHAEASTGNPEASAKPGKWVMKLKERLSREDRQDVLAEIVKDWRAAKATETLDQPIWKERASAPSLIPRGRGASV